MIEREEGRRGIAWVTGASSGIGRASALALADAGFTVAATARRADALDRLVAEIRDRGGAAMAFPADISVASQQSETIARVNDGLGPITTAVLAAGTNTPRRFWPELDMARFTEIVDVNLVSIAAAVHELIPAMRTQGAGQFVLVSSWAAWRHSPGAGVAYAASKSALGVIAETVNAQLGRDGIRACHLCPGDVDTDFLAQRPSEVTSAQRARMLSPDAVARAVRFVATSPAETCVNELVLTPTRNAAYGAV
ncbi:SDR family NAD(P)-dependent oxidoreductase [Microbacterium pseudoresistens]|uniref:NADP-dependent 3-hydroxy acid dehydrogenase YdfG n=1 Tax=Microbacterium pseudoresistens TaxID=640634 RepID=A0A7Y9EW83_9MICO|nr:SDR family oxidoreductase [Microbacterium pseudoresistens]NYD54230.1 NADP-dependent 3-hydroxy acid dehydrogenase YdfG [Microbacterium pseudoresistens]